MDTKWNNIRNKAYAFVVASWRLMVGVVALLGGIYFAWIPASYFAYIPYQKWLAFFLSSNLSFGIGVVLIARYYFKKKYENWLQNDGSFYVDWKNKVSQQKKLIYKIGIILFVCAGMIDYHFCHNDGFWFTFIVCIQIIILQKVLNDLMNKKLDLHMELMEEFAQKNLEKALEIERKSLEKMSRNDQLRIDLITNVSHDLKTPVTSMVGYLELMKKEELSDVMKDYVDVLCSKTDKLKEMINSLFSLAKASSGNIELHMEKFELNRLLEQIMADLKDRIDESELHFVKQFTEESTAITSDNMYFYRICQNLLENALKYSMKGTRVFIKTYVKENEKLCLEITNTSGYFMDFEKEDILERFARGDKARTTDGNGLGLAIVSTYANALGGEFDIKIDCDQFKACIEFPRKNALGNK